MHTLATREASVPHEVSCPGVRVYSQHNYIDIDAIVKSFNKHSISSFAHQQISCWFPTRSVAISHTKLFRKSSLSSQSATHCNKAWITDSFSVFHMYMHTHTWAHLDSEKRHQRISGINSNNTTAKRIKIKKNILRQRCRQQTHSTAQNHNKHRFYRIVECPTIDTRISDVLHRFRLIDIPTEMITVSAHFSLYSIVVQCVLLSS